MDQQQRGQANTSRRAMVTVTVGAIAQILEVGLGRGVDAGNSDSELTVAYPAWVPASIKSTVRSALEETGNVREVLAPQSTGSSLLRAYGPKRNWSAVNVDERAPRLRSVWMPPALATASRILAVNDLRKNTEPRPVIAIGLWALFAHPRQRIGSQLSGNRDGLAAEIALAIDHAQYLVIDRYGPSPALVASHDPIATEVVALGLRRLRTRQREALGTPWEDPLVQRATELELGIPHPAALDLSWIQAPGTGETSETNTRAGVQELAGLIGVTHWSLETLPASRQDRA